MFRTAEDLHLRQVRSLNVSPRDRFNGFRTAGASGNRAVLRVPIPFNLVI